MSYLDDEELEATRIMNGSKKINVEEDIMSEEAFNELIENFEVVESLTKYGRKAIKQNVKKLQGKIKEKDKEIEELKKVLDERFIYVAGARTVYARLMSLDKEDIVKDDLALRNEIYQHIEDKEKKDKIINLMADYVATLDIGEDICANVGNDNCDKMNFGECEECIKQYFERIATKMSQERKEEND